MTHRFVPGSTIGILGGGQLGRMFAFAAKRLGYRVHVYAPESDSPAGQVSDRHTCAGYDDETALAAFAQDVQVVTFEFENVPARAVESLSRHVPVFPDGTVLRTTQHRVREKEFLAAHAIPVVDFRAVSSASELDGAVAQLGYPVVLKTATSGYDGKGQRALRSAADLAHGRELCTTECVAERLIDLAGEFSWIVARGADGTIRLMGPFGNTHTNHILDTTVYPADLTTDQIRQGREISTTIAERFNLIGVLCIEFFRTADGRIYVNELAPRPHNSGHITIEACTTSQYEQQVRAICGFPLGSADPIKPGAMANLLGDLWSAGDLRWEALKDFPTVHLHLYGKEHAVRGRKMGHLSATAESAEEARLLVIGARAALASR